jgi:hypothetical protein
MAAPTVPDRAALEIAHLFLRSSTPLDTMLANPTLRIVLHAWARRHMQRRARPDLKKLQANDHD